jgi:hypothetical protein
MVDLEEYQVKCTSKQTDSTNISEGDNLTFVKIDKGVLYSTSNLPEEVYESSVN